MWISFEWSCKTLKCLQVTNLKAEVQGWGCGAGRRKILGKECTARRCGESQNPQDSPNQRNWHQSRKSSRAREELWLVWFGVGGAEFDGLAVGGVAVGIGPGFFASE